MPVNGLVRSRTQVRTGGVFQAVRRVVSQDGSQFMSAGGGPLLDFVARAEVARIERLAAGNAFVLAMIETDAVLTEFPAELYILIVDDRGKVQESHDHRQSGCVSQIGRAHV